MDIVVSADHAINIAIWDCAKVVIAAISIGGHVSAGHAGQLESTLQGLLWSAAWGTLLRAFLCGVSGMSHLTPAWLCQ